MNIWINQNLMIRVGNHMGRDKMLNATRVEKVHDIWRTHLINN